MTDEVQHFLKTFKAKLKVYDVIYIDSRQKNIQALLDLELFPNERTNILEELELADYCEGPLEETQYGGSKIWVFGKSVKNTEVYIKISLGRTDNPVICISFHPAEHKLTYPFNS